MAEFVEKTVFDLIVIGAGSAGLTAAEYGTIFGAKVLLVEGHSVGGDCTWSGCVPSKAMIHAAAMTHHARIASREFLRNSSSSFEDIKADLKKVKEYVKKTIQDVYEHETPEELLEKKKVSDVCIGHARFIDSRTIEIELKGDTEGQQKQRRQVRAKSGIIVCTGAEPNPFPELTSAWNYLTVWDQDVLPDTLAVIGGGPIGCELAQAFSRLGSKVTMFVRELLPKESDEVRMVMRKRFELEGIKLIFKIPKSYKEEAQEEEGRTTLIMEDGTSYTANKVLVSIGRRCVLPDGLDKIMGAGGIGKDGGLVVNNKLQTKVKGIYAAGDCISGNPQFTHYAGLQGYIAARNASLPGILSEGYQHLKCPRVTFCDPEIAGVGMSSAEAREKGYIVRRLEGYESDRAVCDNSASENFLEMVFDKNGKILGGTCVGNRAGELCCEIALCVQNGLTSDNIGRTIHPYPSHGFSIQILASKDAKDRFSNSSASKILKYMLYGGLR